MKPWLAVALMIGTSAFGSISYKSVYFSGNCIDCFAFDGNAAATGVLTLLDTYNYGDSFAPGDVISFVYSSSLQPGGVTIDENTGTLFTASGSVGPGFPGPFALSISNSNFNFQSFSDGTWCLGGSIACNVGGNVNINLDFGDNGSYDTPEPGTLGLIGLGIAGLAYLRRRRA